MRSRARQGLAVHGHSVVGGDVERRRADHRAVDGNAAGGDPFLGLAARGEARARDRLGDALSGFVWCVVVVHNSAPMRADSRADRNGPWHRSWTWRWRKPAPPASGERCRSAASSCAAARFSPAPAIARIADRDPTAHAEIVAIRRAASHLGSERLDGLRPLRHPGAVRHVRRRGGVRPYPPALLRRRRPERRRRRKRREVFCFADLPSSAGGLWRSRRSGGVGALLKEFFRERR